MSCSALDSIRSDEVLPAKVLCRRLGWGRWTLAKARREGLHPIRYGRGLYYRGCDVVAIFDRLAAAAADKQEAGR